MPQRGLSSPCTQTVELYRGRVIVYSLGNLVFDYYPKDPAIWTGWIVELTFGKPIGLELKTFTVQLDPAGIPHLFGAEKQKASAGKRFPNAGEPDEP